MGGDGERWWIEERASVIWLRPYVLSSCGQDTRVASVPAPYFVGNVCSFQDWVPMGVVLVLGSNDAEVKMGTSESLAFVVYKSPSYLCLSLLMDYHTKKYAHCTLNV